MTQDEGMKMREFERKNALAWFKKIGRIIPSASAGCRHCDKLKSEWKNCTACKNSENGEKHGT